MCQSMRRAKSVLLALLLIVPVQFTLAEDYPEPGDRDRQTESPSSDNWRDWGGADEQSDRTRDSWSDYDYSSGDSRFSSAECDDIFW